MKNNNTVVAAIAAVVVTIVVCATLVLILAPNSDIGPLLAMAAPTVASLAALGVSSAVKKSTDSLTNGLMDAKLRSGMADALPDHLLDPSYVHTQLDADRKRRESGV